MKNGDLYEQIARLVDKHEYRFGHASNCLCGAPGIWFWHDYRAHLAQVIGDHLIDLAGTGVTPADIADAGPEFHQQVRRPGWTLVATDAEPPMHQPGCECNQCRDELP